MIRRVLDILRWHFVPFSHTITIREDRLMALENEIVLWLKESPHRGFRWTGTTKPTEDQRRDADHDRQRGRLGSNMVFWQGLAFRSETDLVMFKMTFADGL